MDAALQGIAVDPTAAILQLLLGNIGRPGGGIMALRGHASIQGSTDIPTLFDLLPGYLAMPLFKEDSTILRGLSRKRYRDNRRCGRTSTSTSSACSRLLRRCRDEGE